MLMILYRLSVHGGVKTTNQVKHRTGNRQIICFDPCGCLVADRFRFDELGKIKNCETRPFLKYRNSEMGKKKKTTNNPFFTLTVFFVCLKIGCCDFLWCINVNQELKCVHSRTAFCCWESKTIIFFLFDSDFNLRSHQSSSLYFSFCDLPLDVIFISEMVIEKQLVSRFVLSFPI